MTVSCLPSSVSVELDCNVNYEVEIPDSSGSWISRRKTGLTDMLDNRTAGIVYGGLRLDVAYNESELERTAAVVVFNSECGVSDTLHIVQTGNPGFYADGQSVCIQKSDDGGANIVLMGDGFTLEDLSVGGRYDSIMRQAAQYFFSIEPYTSYRHFFNVYMVAAVSMQSGVGVRGVKQVDNRFGTRFGSGTSISCNDDLCLEYARKVPGLDVQSPVLVIVVLNSTEYYGTTYMYADGNAIALCPMSARPSPDDFEGLIHHEAGGHGFGFLCDEYVYYYNTQMPENRKSELRRWQDRGFYGNLDFTDDLSSIAWSCFVGMDKYRQVGAFEGGYEYGKGVWRPEKNSCMNDNVPYYNAQSRYLIVNRIMTLSGRYCSVYDFMETDCAADVPVCTRGGAERDFEPLGAPVLKYGP